MKTIIFDFDGTLADTLPVCFYAFQSVFNDFDGVEVDDVAIKAMFGPSETGIIRENLKHPDHDRAIEQYYEKYAEKHDALVEADESITDLLAYLKEQKFLLAIVTGKARRSLDISLEQLEMADLFDYIITGDDVEKAKPHPEGIFKVLDNLKLKKEDVIFVGDSDADIAAGLDAGVHTVGVQWLKNYQALDFTYKPHHHFDDARLFKAYVADYFKEETK